MISCPRNSLLRMMAVSYGHIVLPALSPIVSRRSPGERRNGWKEGEPSEWRNCARKARTSRRLPAYLRWAPGQCRGGWRCWKGQGNEIPTSPLRYTQSSSSPQWQAGVITRHLSLPCHCEAQSAEAIPYKCPATEIASLRSQWHKDNHKRWLNSIRPN